MEVVKRGVRPEDIDWSGICQSCKSEVRAKGHEMTNIQQGGQMDDGPWSWEQCPVCGKKICFHPRKQQINS